MGLELLSNGKTCIVPEAFLLFTREADIKRMSLAADHRVTQIPIKGVEKALAIDFHINDNRIYWADGERQVNILNKNENATLELIAVYIQNDASQ